MTQKILNVKNILRIIISVLIIFSMLKSCARASLSDSLTYNEIDFTGTKQDALEKIWQIFNLQWDMSDSLSSSSQTNRNNMLAALGNYNYMIVGHQISSTISNSYRIVDIWLSGNDHVSQNSAQQFYQLVNYGPNTLIPVFGDFKTTARGYTVTLDSNKYDYVLKYNNGTWLEYSVNDNTIAADTFEFSPNYDAITNYNGYEQLYAKKYDYTINNWLMGEMTPSEKYNQYDIQLLDTGGNIIFKDRYNQEYGTNTNNNLFISTLDKKLYVKSMALSYNKIYTLIIYPLDNDGNITSNNFVGTFMYLPLNATISGDTIVGLGSGDYNIQDNANAVVDTINSLFTMDNNDIQDLRNKISGDLNLGDKIPVGTTIQLLENIQNIQPGDFKISWSSVAYTDRNTQTPIEIIPSGEINFSEKVRNNETAATIHNYTRIIFNGAMGFLILYEIWRCICITLGIGTELYEDYKDENAVITSEHTNTNENTGITTVTVTSRKKRKSWSTTRSGKL